MRLAVKFFEVHMYAKKEQNILANKQATQQFTRSKKSKVCQSSIATTSRDTQKHELLLCVSKKLLLAV